MNTRVSVQKRLIEARVQQDPMFRSILLAVGAKRVRLVHFDRSGAKSFWGASVDAQGGGKEFAWSIDDGSGIGAGSV
jgi:hypothetical protein